MHRTIRGRGVRLLAVATLATTLAVGSPTIGSATPTSADLRAAEAKLQALNGQMDQLVEEWDQAQIKLQQVQRALAGAQQDQRKAQAIVQDARARLSAQAAQAYESQGSAISVILGAASFSELSDRMQFLQAISQQNVDTAAQAQVAGERAREASVRLHKAAQERQAILDQLVQKKAEIQAGVAQTQQLISTIRKSLNRQAARAAIQAAQQPPPAPGSGSLDPGSPRLPSAPGAATAVAWAKSAVGKPYEWGGAGPDSFDCSGLTMWAWAHAGVSLPHSSQVQYQVTRHVARSAIQPGDLLFSYPGITHVSMYIGGGMEVAAHHSGTNVMIDPVPWGSVVGIGRP